VNQAAAIDARLQTFARLQTPSRQRPQLRSFLGQPFAPPRVELRLQLPQKVGVSCTASEVPAASQHQGLRGGFLETSMTLLHVAVLVGMVGLNLLPRHAIVGQQSLIPLRELPLLRQVVDGRAHPVRAVPPRHAAQFAQGVLQSLAQALEALREADRRRLPVRVGQHKVVNQVIETLPSDGDVQLVHGREVGSAQPSRFVDLREEDFLGRAKARAPTPNVPLQRPQLVVGKLPRMTPLQLLENRLGLKTGVGLQQFADRRPDLRKGIRPRLPGVRHGHFTGPLAEPPILACRLRVHVCPPRRPRQRHAVRQQTEQLLHLFVRDHARNPPCTEKLRLAYGHQRPGNLIVVGRRQRADANPIIVVGLGKSNCRQWEE
jgi:hypothetical protein